MSSEKANAARRAYLNRWRSEHREKVKQYNMQYWERVAERMESSEHPDEENNEDRRNEDRCEG